MNDVQQRVVAAARAAAIARLAPVVAALGALLWLAADDGGFELTTWYPAALVVAATLAATALSARALELSGAALVAAAALGAFAAWSYASILWADDRGAAWHGANLTLFYVLLFTLLASSVVRRSHLMWALTAFAAGIAVIGLVVVWTASGSESATDDALLYGRLSAPTGYPNATASLFALAAWLSLGLTTASGLHRLVRGAALASSGVCFGLCILAQSRGWFLTTPIVLVVYVLLARRRLQAIAALAVLGAALAVALPTLLDVFNADDDVPAKLADATRALLGVAGVLFVAGAVLPVLDSVRLPSRLTRVLVGAGALAAAVACVGVLVSIDPVAEARAGWRQFTEDRNASAGGTHFVGFGSNRYDFWRVGLIEFRRNPVGGVGSDNFAIPYVAERRSGEQPLHPHSLWVRTLSQTGIVGSALLLLGIGAAVLAAIRRGRKPLEVALVTAFAAWFLHAQGDWLWEMPALGATAFGLLGLAAGGKGEADVLPNRSRVPAIAVGVVAVASLLSFGAPWLAARYEVSAIQTWRTDPRASIDRLRDAAALNRLSDRPWVVAGAIASRHRDYAAMREYFAAAVERTPRNWYARLELAIAYALTDDRARALEELRIAQQLNPGDDVLRIVARDIRVGKRPDPVAIDAMYREQIEQIEG